MGLIDIADPLNRARSSQDGPEVGGRAMFISQSEMDGIVATYRKPPGLAERTLGEAWSMRVLRSQLTILRDGVGMLNDKDRDVHLHQLAQVEALLDVLQHAGAQATPQDLFQRLVEHTQARLDG